MGPNWMGKKVSRIGRFPKRLGIGASRWEKLLRQKKLEDALQKSPEVA